MRILRNHLIIAFGLVQPEMFIEYITSDKFLDKSCSYFTGCVPSKYIYNHYALEYLCGNTYEEIENLYSDMQNNIEEIGKKLNGNKSIFNIIPQYTRCVLSANLDDPICFQDQKLNWRSCYLQLGQDILTTAHAAYISVRENKRISFFGWPAIIGTDDRRLSEILNEGLAENHFHLNGSVRGFELSWLCLMNHPKQIIDFFKDNPKNIHKGFAENLNSGISLNISDNKLSWKRRILIACWLRVRLFLWLQTGNFGYTSNDENARISLKKAIDSTQYTSSRSLANIISEAKYLYGRKGRIKQPNGHMEYLDYAITSDAVCDERCCCRSLVGECAFLYNAFYAVYSGKTNEREMQYFKELFYLYLLIKSQLRRELIQVNGRYGFKNFAEYQDRKDIIFEHYPKYKLEAYNLSVRDVTVNYKVKSLEMRITPEKYAHMLRNKISKTDYNISFLRETKNPRNSSEKMEQGFNDKCFYTLHFPKIPENKSLPKYEKKEYSFLNHCRNFTLRQKTKLQAMAIAEAFEKYNWLSSRIRGIDACTFEIQCRPEVFSCEFRFLRNFVCSNVFMPKREYKVFVQPKISASYHVGEDFMDIVDGLRAIDETVIFLEMRPYDRLGHAIALGTNVRKYYKLKNNWLILKKQDFLDNIVWALNKSKMFGIDLGSAFKQELNYIATDLIHEIYGCDYNICDYLKSWQLRGDCPNLYRCGSLDKYMYDEILNLKINNITAQYKKYKISDCFYTAHLESIRINNKAAELYTMYHFDYSVRKNGDKCQEFHVTEEYIEMAEALQEGMRNEIAKKRISIECNPSSNVLIGPFELYEQHPIFTFFPVDRQNNDNV